MSPARFRRPRAALWLAGLAIAVAGCSDCELKVDTNALPDGIVGTSYAADLDSDCGGDFWFLQSGTLPPGIGLQDDGDLRGLPTAAGSYAFTVGVIDYSGDDAAYKGLEITVFEE